MTNEANVIRLLKEDNNFLIKDNVSKDKLILKAEKKVRNKNKLLKIVSAALIGSVTYIVIQEVKK